jgi:hypothetical protein
MAQSPASKSFAENLASATVQTTAAATFILDVVENMYSNNAKVSWPAPNQKRGRFQGWFQGASCSRKLLSTKKNNRHTPTDARESTEPTPMHHGTMLNRAPVSRR